MRNYKELKREIEKVIEELESGIMNLDEAKIIINCVSGIIEVDKHDLVECKLKKKTPPDYILNEEQIEDIESMLTLAKIEIKERDM